MIRLLKKIYYRFIKKPEKFTGECQLCKEHMSEEKPYHLKVKTYDGMLNMYICNKCADFFNHYLDHKGGGHGGN